MLNKINNKHLVFLSAIVMILSFALFDNSVKAQYVFINLPPGNNVYNDILYNPSVEQIDLNGQSIIDAVNIDFIIDPGGDKGLNISGAGVSTSFAAEFDGNVEIHGGQLTLSGAIIQPGEGNVLNFPGFLDTPDEYETNAVSTSQQWSFAKRTTITVHNEKVEGNNNLLNFPMLFMGRFDMLKHRIYGGHVSSTIGEDIAFSQDANPVNTSKFLQHELVYYGSTTGDIVAWFTPDLSYDQDTTLYLFYGTDVIEDWEDPTVTWEDYGGVYHMSDALDASQQNDGVFNHAPVTIDDVFVSTSTFPGSSEKAQIFDGADDFMTIPDDSSLDGSSGIAVSAWIKVDSWNTNPFNEDYIVIKGNYANTKTSRSYWLRYSNGNLYWEFYHSGGKLASISASTAGISTGEWHLITGLFDKFSDTAALHVDGALVASVAGLKSSGIGTVNSDVGIGSTGDNGGIGGTDDFDGQIEEVRIQSISDSYPPEFDLTIMNNYLDPYTFYTVDTSDVGKLLGVSSTEADVDFITDNTTYTDLIRSLWGQNGLDIYFDTGMVTVGTGTPTGDLNLSATLNAQIDLQSADNDYWGIYNDRVSNDFRFWNTNQVSGINNMILTTDGKVGIGTNTATDNLSLTGQAYFMQSDAANTLEVYNYDTGGIAVYGEGFYGLYASSSVVSGTAVYGEAVGATSIGVYGIGKIGVYGKGGMDIGAGIEGANALYGGYFTTNDSSGVALYGLSDETYAGVFGENSRTDGGYGVRGDGMYGLYGTSYGSFGAGIRGVATTSFSSYAGYFEGNVSLNRYEVDTPVYLDLYDDPTAPDSTDCDEASEYGRTMFETTNHRLYICVSGGWSIANLGDCGNDIVEGTEACDDGDLVTEGCNNGVKEVGTFCNSDCSLEYDLNEACDYTPQGDDCALVGGSWTIRTGKEFNSYCKNDCSTIMFSCLAP